MKKLFFVMMLFFSACCTYAQSIPQNVVLKTLDDTEVTIKDVLKDDVVILSFWATWCKPCHNELEALKDLQDEWEGNVRIVAVSIDDSRAVSKVKSMVKGKRWPYEILLDENKDLYKALNLSVVPYVMIVDAGKVVWSHSGYVPGNEAVVVDKALEILENRK